MEIRKVEHIGVKVSLLGFGGMRFPIKEDLQKAQVDMEGNRWV